MTTSVKLKKDGVDMDFDNMVDVSQCYECCRFLVHVLNSQMSLDDKEVAAFMLAEMLGQLGKLIKVLE